MKKTNCFLLQLANPIARIFVDYSKEFFQPQPMEEGGYSSNPAQADNHFELKIQLIVFLQFPPQLIRTLGFFPFRS